jgi:FixJ family two-component response regulator
VQGAGVADLLRRLATGDLNGLELQTRLAGDRIDMPIIFITGYGDVPMTVRAMKAGALEFLTKPFDDDVLLRAIRQALERSRTALTRAAEMQTLRDRHASLSGREREVMALVVSGLLNKQVGGELGISEITVKAHRGKVMRKMKARSLAELVNIAAELAVADPAKSRFVADRRSRWALVSPPPLDTLYWRDSYQTHRAPVPDSRSTGSR